MRPAWVYVWSALLHRFVSPGQGRRTEQRYAPHPASR